MLRVSLGKRTALMALLAMLSFIVMALSGSRWLFLQLGVGAALMAILLSIPLWFRGCRWIPDESPKDQAWQWYMMLSLVLALSLSTFFQIASPPGFWARSRHACDASFEASAPLGQGYDKRPWRGIVDVGGAQ